MPKQQTKDQGSKSLLLRTAETAPMLHFTVVVGLALFLKQGVCSGAPLADKNGANTHPIQYHAPSTASPPSTCPEIRQRGESTQHIPNQLCSAARQDQANNYYRANTRQANSPRTASAEGQRIPLLRRQLCSMSWAYK